METKSEKKNEIVAVNPAEQVSPLMPIIAAASTNGEVDADKLLKLLEASERWEAGQAKKAFVKAMIAFKKDPPTLHKDKTVSFKQTSYKHARLDVIIDLINTALGKHELTATFKTDQDEKSVKVTCLVTHVLGHSESCSLSSSPDDSGGKNSIQAIGSAVTYLKRYTLLGVTGLEATDTDDDGAGANGNDGPPEPSKKAEKVLEQVCNKMIDSVPEGLILVDELVDKVIYAQWGRYPEDIKTAGATAASLINILNETKTWHTVTKEANA